MKPSQLVTMLYLKHCNKFSRKIKLHTGNDTNFDTFRIASQIFCQIKGGSNVLRQTASRSLIEVGFYENFNRKKSLITGPTQVQPLARAYLQLTNHSAT